MATSAARSYHSKGRANLPDREVLLDLFERMILLRRFESVAQIACRKGETPGFLHLYIGEEATGVGVCAHLRQDRLGDVDASRPRTCARQGRRSRPRDGGTVRQGRRHLRRSRRHDASLRQVGRAVRHQRHRSSGNRSRGRHRHERAAARQRRHRRRLLRRRRRKSRQLPRGAQFRGGAARAGRLRLREQPLRHGDAAEDGYAQSRRSPPRRSPMACRGWQWTATTSSQSGWP